jgi:hypothetical protein
MVVVSWFHRNPFAMWEDYIYSRLRCQRLFENIFKAHASAAISVLDIDCQRDSRN